MKSLISLQLDSMEKATIPLPGFEQDKLSRFGNIWRFIGVLGLILTLYQVNVLQMDYFTYPYETRVKIWSCFHFHIKSNNHIGIA